MIRYAGTVERLATVDIDGILGWLAGISFDEWPQQSRLELRPAMVTDLDWHGFGDVTEPMVNSLMGFFPGCVAEQRMLSVVMPGHSIDPHVDRQSPHWVCRVHVPLTSNDQSVFMVGGEVHRLEPGEAYEVNTEAEHSVANDGLTPRVHFMFDVRN